jgi:site-specific DNA recombinase
MMHLRQPILLPKEQPLRALIHARFSTEEQRQSSIDDQVASCRTFLESNLPKGWKPEQVEIDVIAEPEVSGEIADRPGINQVWAGIEAKRWHLIIAEESSRLYRHHTKAGELFESAVDADVRVICTSDYIDTADDDWPDRLHMSQMQHARSNFYTRKRIERAHDGLWARGAAVGNTVIGYKRRPTLPATETEPAKGPFYDEIDEEKAVVIREVFERVAAAETAAEVGEWLDSIKFAKAKWSRQAKWTAGNVNAIIRRTIYRGFETFRKKKAQRKLRTGKSEYVWNDEDKIQTRESPHLRIVSDHLWYGANEVVDKRRVFQKPVRGAGHPLRGTTRQRRGLLAGVFVCGVCGAPMYSYGKTDGSFRCSASATGKCWNRVYCMRERVYPAVLEAVVNEVLSLDGVRDVVLARVKELHEKGGAVAAELKKLDKEEKRLVAGIERLSAAVESGDGEGPAIRRRVPGGGDSAATLGRAYPGRSLHARSYGVPHGELRRDRAAHGSRGARGAVPTADREARPCAAVVQQALAKGWRPQGRWQTPPGVMMSGARGRGRDLRLWAPDFMAAGGLSLFGVLDDGREIVAELFSNSSPSRVNVFDRRVAIRRFLCHRSTTPRACR